MYPIAEPRKYTLPPIHERPYTLHSAIRQPLNPVYGITNPWLFDIFREYMNVVGTFSFFKKCLRTISEHGTCYDKDVIRNDYNPLIKDAVKAGYIAKGIKSNMDLIKFLNINAAMKEMMVILSFVHDERIIDIYEEEYYKNKLAEEKLSVFKPEIISAVDRYCEVKEHYDLEMTEFIEAFEDALNNPDESLMFKFNQNHARIYMMVNNIEFKNLIRDYETYCKILAICEARYDELVISRFNKEANRIRRLKNTPDDITDDQIIDMLMGKWERDDTNKSYNPRFYMDLIRDNTRHAIPRNFKFIESSMDTTLLKKILFKFDKFANRKVDFNWTGDDWNSINRLERILNLDDIRLVKGIPVEHPLRSKKCYDYDIIRSISV